MVDLWVRGEVTVNRERDQNRGQERKTDLIDFNQMRFDDVAANQLKVGMAATNREATRNQGHARREECRERKLTPNEPKSSCSH